MATEDIVAKLVVAEARAIEARLPVRRPQAKSAARYRKAVERLRRLDRTPDDYSGHSREVYRAAVTFTAMEQLRAGLRLYDEAVKTGDQELLRGCLLILREAMDWLKAYPPTSPEEAIQKIQGNRWHALERRERKSIVVDGREGRKGKRPVRQEMTAPGYTHVESGLIWSQIDQDSPYRDGVAALLLTGARPIEAQRGIQVRLDEQGQTLEFVWRTAKTQGKYGQPIRRQVVAIDLPWAFHLAGLARDAGGKLIVSCPRAGNLSRLFWRIGEKLKSEGLIDADAVVSAYTRRNEVNAVLEATGDTLAAEVGTGHRLKVGG